MNLDVYKRQGFDFMTFDEVHNANHIVGKVKLDKKVASDFRSQNQRTSDPVSYTHLGTRVAAIPARVHEWRGRRFPGRQLRWHAKEPGKA